MVLFSMLPFASMTADALSLSLYFSSSRSNFVFLFNFEWEVDWETRNIFLFHKYIHSIRRKSWTFLSLTRILSTCLNFFCFSRRQTIFFLLPLNVQLKFVCRPNIICVWSNKLFEILQVKKCRAQVDLSIFHKQWGEFVVHRWSNCNLIRTWFDQMFFHVSNS